MLAAKFKYADVTHAHITRLDISAAKAIPGVFAVLTQDDVPDVKFGPFVQDRTLFANATSCATRVRSLLPLPPSTPPPRSVPSTPSSSSTTRCPW
jgi:CO/xanthine dehydrogenase Mo-binding subunit